MAGDCMVGTQLFGEGRERANMKKIIMFTRSARCRCAIRGLGLGLAK